MTRRQELHRAVSGMTEHDAKKRLLQMLIYTDRVDEGELKERYFFDEAYRLKRLVLDGNKDY